MPPRGQLSTISMTMIQYALLLMLQVPGQEFLDRTPSFRRTVKLLPRHSRMLSR
jgi:hypothetical protein